MRAALFTRTSTRPHALGWRVLVWRGGGGGALGHNRRANTASARVPYGCSDSTSGLAGIPDIRSALRRVQVGRLAGRAPEARDTSDMGPYREGRARPFGVKGVPYLLRSGRPCSGVAQAVVVSPSASGPGHLQRSDTPRHQDDIGSSRVQLLRHRPRRGHTIRKGRAGGATAR